MSMKNPLTLTGIEPATFRFVAQHLNHCATAVTAFTVCPGKITFFGFDLDGVTRCSVKAHIISVIKNCDSRWLENCTLLGYYTASSGNHPEQRSSRLLRGGSFKSRIYADSVFGLYHETPWFLLLILPRIFYGKFHESGNAIGQTRHTAADERKPVTECCPPVSVHLNCSDGSLFFYFSLFVFNRCV